MVFRLCKPGDDSVEASVRCHHAGYVGREGRCNTFERGRWNVHRESRGAGNQDPL